VEWPIRGATMAEWIRQGYPQGVPPQEFFGLDPYMQAFPVNMYMHPPFETTVLKEDDNYKIWQDGLGAIRKDFKTVENEGFVTRSWLKFPVHDRASFREITARYNPADSARFPADFAQKARVISGGDVATHVHFQFLFWNARDWFGFENLCMLFYDDPALVHEMFAFITDFVIETFRPVIHLMDIDLVEIKEDMAYKHAPMISPEMFRKFMLPHYVRVIDFFKSNGAKKVFVDCDGYPGGLIPLWIEAGVDAMTPTEIAAGNDVAKLQKEYPGFGLFGGVDKRVLAQDKGAIYDMVKALLPCIEKGGFIPHVDHAIPHNVPLENYIYFRDLIIPIPDKNLTKICEDFAASLGGTDAACP